MSDTSKDNVLKGSTFGIDSKEIEIPVSDILAFEETPVENIREVTYQMTVQTTVELNINSPVSCKVDGHTYSKIEDIDRVIHNCLSQRGK